MGYHKIWKKFNEFIIQLDRIPRTWEDRTALYCAYLICIRGLKSSTVRSYVSAIKAVLRKDGYEWSDDKVLLSTLTKSCKLKNDTVKTRLPIQQGLLDLILFDIRRKFETQPYLEAMYITAYLFAYYGLMRVGEIADSQHSVKAKNVHESKSKNKILIILYTSKTHGIDKNPQKIKLIGKNYLEVLDITNKQFSSKGQKMGKFCPVEWARKYITMRGPRLHDDENLFRFSDGSNIQAHHLRELLRSTIKSFGLDPSLYDTHSFRIGRATDLFKQNTSVDNIKHLGRWKSNAVYKYLRN